MHITSLRTPIALLSRLLSGSYPQVPLGGAELINSPLLLCSYRSGRL
jgi:hypothetical protein